MLEAVEGVCCMLEAEEGVLLLARGARSDEPSAVLSAGGYERRTQCVGACV